MDDRPLAGLKAFSITITTTSMHYKKSPRPRRRRFSSLRLGAAAHRTMLLRCWWHSLTQTGRSLICEEPKNSATIPSCGILSERSSPSRDRFARAQAAPLTAPGRSEPLPAKKGMGFSGLAPRTQSRPWALARYGMAPFRAGGLKMVNAFANSRGTGTGVDNGTLAWGKDQP